MSPFPRSRSHASGCSKKTQLQKHWRSLGTELDVDRRFKFKTVDHDFAVRFLNIPRALEHPPEHPISNTACGKF